MNSELMVSAASSIKGHMIALGARHSIAIYERNGEHYVAEFRGGHGEITYAASWFRFYSGSLRYHHNGRLAVDSSTALSPEMLQTIERLHAESEARQERRLALPRTVAAATRRYLTNVTLRLRGRAAKINQTFG